MQTNKHNKQELFDEDGSLKAASVVFFARIIAFYEELFDEDGSLEVGFCRFFARIIAFYEELFDEDGSLEVGFCRFSRALSRFMKSSLTRTVRLKSVSVVFHAHYRVL
jgi:hypothetical protein